MNASGVEKTKAAKKAMFVTRKRNRKVPERRLVRSRDLWQGSEGSPLGWIPLANSRKHPDLFILLQLLEFPPRSRSLIILHLQDNKIFWPKITSLPSQAQIPRNRAPGSQFVGQVKGTVFQRSSSRELSDRASQRDPAAPRLFSEVKDTDGALACLCK